MAEVTVDLGSPTEYEPATIDIPDALVDCSSGLVRAGRDGRQWNFQVTCEYLIRGVNEFSRRGVDQPVASACKLRNGGECLLLATKFSDTIGKIRLFGSKLESRD